MKNCKLIHKLLKPFTSGYGYANPSQPPKTRYAKSINEKLVWINIENMGQFERVAAIEGETLL